MGAQDLSSSRGERIVVHNVLVSAGTMSAGVLGFAFQIVVSHRVQPSQYGAIFTVMTLLTLVGLPASALTLMMAREASRDRANGQHASSAAMLHDGNRLLLLGGLAIAAVALLASPLLSRFFEVPIDLSAIFRGSNASWRSRRSLSVWPRSSLARRLSLELRSAQSASSSVFR